MSVLSKPKRLMDEAQVKKMLGIDDFRKLDKKTVIEFISAIPQMDPDVAMKALEQFPELANMALGIAKETRESLTEALAANDKSSEASLSVINTVIEILENELKKDELTADERLHVVDCLTRIAEEGRAIHKDNQNFILKGLTIFASVMSVTVLGAVAVLGANGRAQLPDFSEGEDEDREA